MNISEEKVIDFDEAAKLIPGRDGGTAHKVTLMKYTKRGLCGVRLESVLAGPGRCTSVQAVQRFIDAVNEARNKRPKLPDRYRFRTGRSGRRLWRPDSQPNRSKTQALKSSGTSCHEENHAHSK